MGPNESKLAQIKSAAPGTVSDKQTQWDAANEQVDIVLNDLRKHRDRTLESWKGEDSTAATAAFDKKIAEVEEYRDRMKKSATAMAEASEALTNAQTALSTLPSVGDAPTAPTPLDAGASKEVRDLHDDKVADYKADQAAHDLAVQRREDEAAKALRALDARIKAAQALLAQAAPRGDNPRDSSDQNTGTPGGSPTGGGTTGGSSGTPVVGGSTSAGLIRGATVVATGGKKNRGPRLEPVETPTPDGTTGTDSLTAGQTPTNPGTLSGGGIGAAASGAGLLGAGRGIVSKLTGAGSSASASGAARTAGMQNGSTLGNRTAGASPSSQAQGNAARGSAAQAGQGQPGQAGRTGASQAGQASRPGATQAGRPGSSSGARSGPGSNSAGRPGSRTAGNGPRAGGPASRSAGKPGDDKDVKTDHLAFEDDQWLDDEETAPGVIT